MWAVHFFLGFFLFFLNFLVQKEKRKIELGTLSQHFTSRGLIWLKHMTTNCATELAVCRSTIKLYLAHDRDKMICSPSHPHLDLICHLDRSSLTGHNANTKCVTFLHDKCVSLSYTQYLIHIEKGRNKRIIGGKIHLVSFVTNRCLFYSTSCQDVGLCDRIWQPHLSFSNYASNYLDMYRSENMHIFLFHWID